MLRDKRTVAAERAPHTGTLAVRVGGIGKRSAAEFPRCAAITLSLIPFRFPMPKEPFELERLAQELGVDKDGEDSSKFHDLPSLEPLSHQHPHLKAATFDVEDFLLSRAYTSLPDLGSELKEYGARLKEELVQLINEDYEAFISLSTDLRGEGARLERLHWPLPALRKEIEVRSRLPDLN